MSWATVENLGEFCNLDFSVQNLGPGQLDSPLTHVEFVNNADHVSYFTDTSVIGDILNSGKKLPAFELAGPRQKIYHDPAWTRAAIVTCGGLCPGLNDVIKAITNTLCQNYGVRHVYGIRYGYRGLVAKYGLEPMLLTPDVVDCIHENGGSILGSSRGQQPTDQIVQFLHRMNINVLFCIGGDGTLRGARDIADEVTRMKLPISVVGVPKTIDNDVSFMERTFGFETAVYSAAPVISCAHDEAKGTFNGIGLVKLMGRDSGFIAAYTTLANSLVNFCLIPEQPFDLDGPSGFLACLKRRLELKEHAVIVVAEGAGQELFSDIPEQRDASGNLLHNDIGLLLKAKIKDYLKEHGVDHSVKYFDPSYMIRSVPARGTDAVFCLHLAQNAVHAAMSGRTNMVVGYWHGHFNHVPIALATSNRREIAGNSQLWQSVLGVTRQGSLRN